VLLAHSAKPTPQPDSTEDNAVPTNEQRRQAAKRKLERQLERRQERARKRRQLTVALSAVGVVAVAGIVILLVSVTRGGNTTTSAAASTTASAAASPTPSGAPSSSAAPAAAAVPLPTARATPLAATVDCTYPPTSAAPAAKPNTAPSGSGVSAAGTVAVAMKTSAGDIPLTLDRGLAPCTVQSFLNLARQQYFDSTPCHRLTTQGIKVLQCGDPSGKGTGGPGYSFANEFPTDQFATGDPAAQRPATYPRGSIAMANAGAGTNGSQFFLVYGDSPLPPQYTVFGTISAAGLSVLDAIAAAGTSNGSGDGPPATPVTITTMTAAA